MPILSSIAKNLKQVAYNLSDLEMKTLEATNTDPWGPHGTAMYEIASACINHEGFGQVFAILRKRLALQAENWRQVYKALLVIEYMIKHCPRFVVEHIKDENTVLRRLRYFEYKGPDGRDHGINVRTRAETLIKLLQDGDALNDERQKAKTATRKLAKGFSREEQVYYKNSPTAYKAEAKQYGGGSSSFGSTSAEAPSSGLEAPVKVNIPSSVNQASAQRAKMTLSQTKVNSKISATFSNYAVPKTTAQQPPAAAAPAPAPVEGGEVWADFSTPSAGGSASTPPPPAASASVDLLGGLDTVAPPVAQAQAPPTTSASSSGFDAFGGDASQGGFTDFSAAAPVAAEDPFAKNKSAVEAAFNSAPPPAPFQPQPNMFAPQPQAPQGGSGFGGMMMPQQQQQGPPTMMAQPGMMPMPMGQPGMMPQMMMQGQMPHTMVPQMPQQMAQMQQMMMQQPPQGAFNNGIMAPPQGGMMQQTGAPVMQSPQSMMLQPNLMQRPTPPPPTTTMAATTAAKDSTPSKDLFADLLG